MVRRKRSGDEETLVALTAAYERPIPGDGDVLHDERAHVLAAFREDRPVGYALVYNEAAMALYAAAGAERGAKQVLWTWEA